MRHWALNSELKIAITVQVDTSISKKMRFFAILHPDETEEIDG